MKIAVIGGGSTYTPELVSGLSRERDRIDVTELALHDIDAERREVVGGMAGRMLARQGFDGELARHRRSRPRRSTAPISCSSRSASAARRRASRTRRSRSPCGCIGQETTGAGGLGKALRTVPVVLEIADRVRERAASDAWIVDFTNPVGIVTRALLDAGHRAIGLCNVAIGFQRQFASLLGVPPADVVVDQVGLNHLTWIRARPHRRHRRPPAAPGRPRRRARRRRWRCRGGCSTTLGVIPSYYLRYFYAHDIVLDEQLDGVPRAAAVAEIEQHLLELYRDPSVDEKPALLEQRGGAFYSEAATGLVASLVSGSSEVHEVDIRNNGTLAGLADDDVVEVPATIVAGVPVPLPQEPLAPELLGLAQHVAAYERLAVGAALSGNPADVRKALLAHPLIGQWEATDELVDLLLAADAAQLPRFAGSQGAPA